MDEGGGRVAGYRRFHRFPKVRLNFLTARCTEILCSPTNGSRRPRRRGVWDYLTIVSREQNLENVGDLLTLRNRCYREEAIGLCSSIRLNGPDAELVRSECGAVVRSVHS